MFRRIVPALVAILAVYAASNFIDLQEKGAHKEIPSHIHKAFAQWLKEHGKTYQSPAEYIHRIGNFYKTYAKIHSLRSGHSSVKLGLNKFSDLSREEFKAKHTGYRPLSKITGVKRTKLRFDPLQENPSSVDWRRQSRVAGIKNQKSCGSCWAYAAVASVEYALAKRGGSLTTLSEQQLVDCSNSYGNGGCDGGNAYPAMEYIVDKGITSEANYRYTSRQSSCKASGKPVVTKISEIVEVQPKSGKALENAVAQAVLAIVVDSYNMMSYEGGIMTSSFCDYYAADHAVNLIGYGTNSSGKDYWIMRNSWGTDWGINGYAWVEKNLSRSGVGACGIRLEPIYAVL